MNIFKMPFLMRNFTVLTSRLPEFFFDRKLTKAQKIVFRFGKRSLGKRSCTVKVDLRGTRCESVKGIVLSFTTFRVFTAKNVWILNFCFVTRLLSSYHRFRKTCCHPLQDITIILWTVHCFYLYTHTHTHTHIPSPCFTPQVCSWKSGRK